MKGFLILLILFNVVGCNLNPSLDKKSATNNISNAILKKDALKKIVIAHRGASGYLPEHSIAAKAMAYAMGADYIEQDVVMTKDDQLIVLHDLYLDRVTNVMNAFPNRWREAFGEKRWFAIDFTLTEIKTLKMTEAFSIDEQSDEASASYPQRFPPFMSSFHVSTLAEEIELIQGLNKSTGNNVGIYVEVKAPWFHYSEGKDISQTTLEIIKQYGYTSKRDSAYIQCFDPDETRRINDQLMPALNMDLNVVQLIAKTEWNETMRLVDGKFIPYSYEWMFEAGAMKKIAEYADGIGPWKPMIVSDESTAEKLVISTLVSEAHEAGMVVHPYTFRSDPGRIPDYAINFDDMLNIFFNKANVDGVFTDFPDKAVAFLRKQNTK